jgi:lysozyme
MIPSINCVNLIKKWEGFRAKPYQTVYNGKKDVPTIGYGSTFYLDGKKVSMQDQMITESTASEMLSVIVNDFATRMIPYIKSKLNQNQFDALVCFSYNVGLGNFIKSTLLKKVNNSDFNGASSEFLKWNKCQGKVVTGLTNRRNDEKTLFLKV